MPDKDYSHRDVTDKLGIKPGHAVAVVNEAGAVAAQLARRAVEKAGRPLAAAGEAADVVLVAVDDSSDFIHVLERWRERIVADGGIWMLTPKRGQPGYVDQNELVEAGKVAGVVDNKVWSVDERTSAMRFVIQREDRKKQGVLRWKDALLAGLRPAATVVLNYSTTVTNPSMSG